MTTSTRIARMNPFILDWPCCWISWVRQSNIFLRVACLYLIVWSNGIDCLKEK